MAQPSGSLYFKGRPRNDPALNWHLPFGHPGLPPVAQKAIDVEVSAWHLLRRPRLCYARSVSRSWPSQVAGFAGWMLAVFAAAAAGAVASVDAASFYAQLDKPSWAPPAWVFGPVWTALYSLMGISAWLVWRTARFDKVTLSLFAGQLAANALWSWLFFAWHLGALATAEVLVLLALIAATVAAFWRKSRVNSPPNFPPSSTLKIPPPG